MIYLSHIPLNLAGSTNIVYNDGVIAAPPDWKIANRALAEAVLLIANEQLRRAQARDFAGAQSLMSELELSVRALPKGDGQVWGQNIIKAVQAASVAPQAPVNLSAPSQAPQGDSPIVPAPTTYVEPAPVDLSPTPEFPIVPVVIGGVLLIGAVAYFLLR